MAACFLHAKKRPHRRLAKATRVIEHQTGSMAEAAMMQAMTVTVGSMAFCRASHFGYSGHGRSHPRGSDGSITSELIGEAGDEFHIVL